jgi:phthalate 4,5-dioxygenase
MGFDINIHDQWACESQGRIQDRTREHLASTDKGIALYRRILLDSIAKNQAGEKPPMVLDAQSARGITGPPAVDGIGPSDRLEEYWKEFDANRRRRSAWAA